MKNKLFLRLSAATLLVTLAFTANAGGHKSADPAQGNVLETAVAAGSFSTLISAVQAAGLVETLQGEGPFTIWAPTDEAFAALPSGTLENLLKPENKDQLTAVLLYHVVPGKANSEQVLDWAVNGVAVATLQGAKISALSEGGTITINSSANVVKADVQASNGVIHVIDAVLLPPST